MTRASRSSVYQLALIAILIVGIAPALGAQSASDLIAQADLAYMTRTSEESLLQALALLEAAVPELESLPLQSQASVLDRLSQLCYEATTFVDGNASEERALYEKGKAYGLQSLRLSAEFAEAERQHGLNEAVACATDVAALHWTASNWGKLCGLNPIVGLTQQDSVLALFSRAVEVDATYWGGSASSSLGSLLIMSPATLGGDKEAGLALVENSIVLDPSYLPNRVILAEYWGFTYNFFGSLTGVRDAELIERELNIVLDAQISDWPFWNANAKESAVKLLAQLKDMTD